MHQPSCSRSTEPGTERNGLQGHMIVSFVSRLHHSLLETLMPWHTPPTHHDNNTISIETNPSSAVSSQGSRNAAGNHAKNFWISSQRDVVRIFAAQQGPLLLSVCLSLVQAVGGLGFVCVYLQCVCMLNICLQCLQRLLE